MAREKYTNSVTTTLNGSINNTTTSVVVTDASTFPASGYFRILVENEIMLVTSRSTNTLTVVRGQEGTTAASHTTGVDVNHIFTAGALDNFRKGILGDMGVIDNVTTNSSSDDDYFDDENFSGWTTIQDTAGCVVTEKFGRASVVMNGSGSLTTFAFIKNKTPSAGDWVQAGMTWAGLLVQYPLFGVVMADGATFGSGKQIQFMWSMGERLYAIGKRTNWTTNSGSPAFQTGATMYPFMSGNVLHMRMVYEAVDTYSGYISPDAISWAKVFNSVSLAHLGAAPTWLGFMCGNQTQGSGLQIAASFSYCRFSF